MGKLSGFQRKYLRGLAHNLDPVVFIGQKGLADTVVKAADSALMAHELIKLKFVDIKDKEKKQDIIAELEKRIGCEKVGSIGHVFILFRQNRDPLKRKITVPEK